MSAGFQWGRGRHPTLGGCEPLGDAGREPLTAPGSRERRRERERQRETETDTERQRKRQRETETERDRDRERKTETERETERQRQRKRDRDRERQRERETEIETDRETETERERDGCSPKGESLAPLPPPESGLKEEVYQSRVSASTRHEINKQYLLRKGESMLVN